MSRASRAEEARFHATGAELARARATGVSGHDFVDDVCRACGTTWARYAASVLDASGPTIVCRPSRRPDDVCACNCYRDQHPENGPCQACAHEVSPLDRCPHFRLAIRGH